MNCSPVCLSNVCGPGLHRKLWGEFLQVKRRWLSLLGLPGIIIVVVYDGGSALVKLSSIFPIPLPWKTCKKSCLFTSVIFIKILHSGAFQSSRIQKFPCDINENPSFWSISEQQNSKFRSTMVKIFSVVFTKSLNFGAFHIVITLNLGGKWHFQASGKEKSHNFLEGFALHFWQQSVKSISFSLLSQWKWYVLPYK